jgi:hypothetical protein
MCQGHLLHQCSVLVVVLGGTCLHVFFLFCGDRKDTGLFLGANGEVAFVLDPNIHFWSVGRLKLQLRVSKNSKLVCRFFVFHQNTRNET